MLPDLSAAFSRGESDDAFAADRVSRRHALHVTRRAASLISWAVLAARLWGSAAMPFSLLGLASALAASLVALRASSLPLSLLFPVEAAIDVVQPLCAVALFGSTHAAAAGASGVRALACVLAGNGVAALAARARASPLPARWQLPVLLASGGGLLAAAPAMGASPALQHGYAALGTLGRVLLPLVAPAFLDLAPADGFAALLAPAPDPAALPPGEAAARAATCAACQAAAVVAGCAAVAVSLCRSEQRDRKAFEAQRAQRAGPTALARPA